MDEELFSALLACSISALGAGLHAWRILANKGLVSPQDIDEMAHGLTIPFAELGGGEVSARIRACIDEGISPALAEVHRSARANWKG